MEVLILDKRKKSARSRASLDNPGYYYNQMIRKGLYYVPYVLDFTNGQGIFAQ
ncbi:MAG: hypothetical protein KDK90_27865 [Leptospiraceae bacterium]|nr:hypothetical protein [Leptospiraceae bacterium]